MSDVQIFVSQKDFNFEPVFNGKIHRFKRFTTSESAWFIGHERGGFKYLCFGDWQTSEKYEWHNGGNGSGVSYKEAEDIRRQMRDDYEKDKKEAQLNAQAECIDEWENYLSDTDTLTAYSLRKKLTSLHGAKTNDANTIFVPMYDEKECLWNLQRIYSDGTKRFGMAGKIKGLFFPVHCPLQKEAEIILLCEGYATACTIHEALSQKSSQPSNLSSFQVVACFTAHNLKDVAMALRALYPVAKFVVCGDDDQFTILPNGEKKNVGRNKALEAAHDSRGICVFPQFDGLQLDTSLRPTDFNDLAVYGAMELVYAQIAGALKVCEGQSLEAGPTIGENTQKIDSNDMRAPDAPETAPVSLDNIKTITLDSDCELPSLCTMSREGRPRLPNQQVVVDFLIKQAGGMLLKEDKNIFQYNGIHWEMWKDKHYDSLSIQIQKLCGGVATYPYIHNIKSLFLDHCPHIPGKRSFFTPQTYSSNFTNGTLHVLKINQKTKFKYEMKFQSHKKEDYLLNCLPVEYTDENIDNLMLQELFNKLFGKDFDAAQKVRAIAQMFGGLLCPVSARLFMLHGVPKTGKSTVIKLAKRLVSPENCSQVQPHQLNGFNMEMMAGKIANIDSDINVNLPIVGDVVRKIQEREPFRICRKGRPDIYAPLPPIHIFGGNGVPPSIEGSIEAHRRRWTFIKFNYILTQEDNCIEDYDELIFDSSPEGFISFARSGLIDLINSNLQYFQPASGQLEFDRWANENAPVKQFVNELYNGQIVDLDNRPLVPFNNQIKPNDFWEIFKNWKIKSREVAFTNQPIGRNEFYRELEKLGIVPNFKNNARCLIGFKPTNEA